MRFLLIGANGRLGRDLCHALAGEDVAALGREQLDLRDAVAVSAAVESARPDCILNAAAFNFVDDCETQPEQAWAVNATGAYHLARAAEHRRTVLVHFSTDYVFDGVKRSPYTETDPPAPLSLYGLSKLAGEWAVRQSCEKHFIIRTSTLFGPFPPLAARDNFVEKMLRQAAAGLPVRAAHDQWRSPTCTRDLAQAVWALIQSRSYGLYHITNSGECSLFEFAKEIFRVAGLAPELLPVSSEAFGLPARRPAYSVLAHATWRAAGFPELRSWQDSLSEYLHTRQQRAAAR